MQIEQFVMAYSVEQDRLRALLPEGFLSFRPVLRINAEIRGGQTGYLELNTAVERDGLRGWLNIGFWENVPFEREGKTVLFHPDFLELRFTPSGSRVPVRRKRTTPDASSPRACARRRRSPSERNSATVHSAGAFRRATPTASASAGRCPPARKRLRPSIRKSPAPRKTRQGSPAVRCWKPIRSASSASPEFFRVPSMWNQACRFWKVLL